MANDYIRREDAIDAVCTEWCGNAHDAHCDACAEVRRIKALPAADVVKVRHAKDVYKQYNKHHCEFMCSLCGGWIGVIEGGDCDFNYCPNCGAKMDGGDEHG